MSDSSGSSPGSPEEQGPGPGPGETPRPPRRKRYRGRNPRAFEEKYKEHQRDVSTLEKVLASGKTPAGTHVPILVPEILQVLALQPGEFVVDATLGYGGHASALLESVQPGGHLLGLDVDPVELPRTTLRLRQLGFGEGAFTPVRSNFAGLPKVLAGAGRGAADAILADLGVSSMQIDNPARGFSFKTEGPLDMRLNPERGVPASRFLAGISAEKLAFLLGENSDEPDARRIAEAIAGREFATTLELTKALNTLLPDPETGASACRRVFQTLRIEVNEEFTALDTFLRNLPHCLRPGGRVAVLTFHSGEDRRVKKAFAAGWKDGTYAEISPEVIRPGHEELRANPRSSSAKLRWARRSGQAI